MHPSAVGSRDAHTYVISGAEALARFSLESGHFLGRGAYQQITVALPVARRARFESRINTHYRQCGCLASGITVLATIGALAVWDVVYSAAPTYGWVDMASDAGIVMVVGALAKVTAIGHAHWALKRTLRELANALDAEHPEGALHDRLS